MGRWCLSATGDPAETAGRYHIQRWRGEVGFINPVSEPFCATCDRISADSGWTTPHVLLQPRRRSAGGPALRCRTTMFWRYSTHRGEAEELKLLLFRQAFRRAIQYV